MPNESPTRMWIVSFLSALLGGAITLSSDLVKSHFTEAHEKENVTRALLVEVRELTHQVHVQQNWLRSFVNPQEELQPFVPYRTNVYDNSSAKMDRLDPNLAQHFEARS